MPDSPVADALRRAVGYASSRLPWTSSALLLVVLVISLLPHLAPGDADGALPENVLESDAARPWSPPELLELEFGWSSVHERPISRLLLERLATTLTLTVGSLCIAFVLGSVLGTLATRSTGSPFDLGLRCFVFLFHAMPSYFLGLVLIGVFALELHWLPPDGIAAPATLRDGIGHALDVTRHLLMPMATLVLIYTALYARLMRASVLHVASLAHVRTARSKGLDEAIVVRHHIVSNALLPLVGSLGYQFTTLLGTSVAIETLFAIPGLGQLAHESFVRRELPTLGAVIVLCASLVFVADALFDLLHAGLDARVSRR